MRKRYQNLLVAGFLIGLFVVGYYAVAKPGTGGGFIDITKALSGNSTENTTYQLAISNIQATVDQGTGHVVVSFQLTNEEHFNVSSVQVLYALNVADPNNATYTPVNASEVNGTWSAEIPSKFGDVVYYKAKVVYDVNKELTSDVKSVTVKDMTAPTISSVSLNLVSNHDNATNTTTYSFQINFNATDNDAIATYYVYYADLGANSTITNTTTFTEVNATALPVTITNVTANNYYAFYFVVEDLSGNKATLYNGTSPYIIQANASATWPVVVKQSSS